MYKPYSTPISVKGIIFENDCVWLRKNERNEWELPGGKLDEGEQPIETVKREMFEELGFEVEVLDLVQAYVYTIEKSIDEYAGVMVISYLCRIVDKVGDFELMGEAGPAQFMKFSIDEINALKMPNFYKVAINNAGDILNKWMLMS
jgi:8-oxo-dGTP pyrophosphatase MutT (NUDIX family)